MKAKLGVLVFLYYFQIELSNTESTAQNGFCEVEHDEQVPIVESYIHEYTLPELRLCSYGHRYYNCWKDIKKKETRTRTVPKTVKHKEVKCCDGYKNITVHSNIFDCEPICDPPCIKGHCSMPGNCTCFRGFEHVENNECVPSCKPNCINGICTSPGHCECKEGYDKVNTTYCEPHCPQKCKNGVCYKPGECLCNTGYTKSTKDPYNCEPICDLECFNSTCTSYNECTCWNGYRKNLTQSNACMPICELECLNGDCTAPDTCTCHEGYSKDDSLNICKPDCANCYNGFCTKPNECSCYDNYTIDNYGNCEPICNNCTNGRCIAPYECDCIEGYKLDDEEKCVPYCDGCENGICIEPDVCNCYSGYENTDGSCLPSCDFRCFGGECIAPNNCSCLPDYDRVEDNICFPLQNNDTNSTESSITPKRFVVEIMKILESTDIYDIHLSTVYVRINCSYVTTNKTDNGSEVNSSNSVECSNIRNALGLYVFCIWNNFSSGIMDLFTEYLPSIIHESNGTEAEKHYEVLGMTVLFPTDMMSKENEQCYLCPRWKNLRMKMPGNFSIPFVSCELKHLQSAVISTDWTGIGVIGLGVLVALLLITIGLMIFFRKHLRGDYFVHSSRQVDEIALSLTQEE